MRRSAATAQVEYLQRRSPALHKAVLSSLFFKQPSRVKPLLTFGSGAGSMSHCADWLPLAANAGLSWVSAAVWGGVSECSKKDTEKIENRFLSSFGLFAWVFFFRGGFAAPNSKCRRRRHRLKVIRRDLVDGFLRVWVCFAGAAEIYSCRHFVLSVVSLLPPLCLPRRGCCITWRMLTLAACALWNANMLVLRVWVSCFYVLPYKIGLTVCCMIVYKQWFIAPGLPSKTQKLERLCSCRVVPFICYMVSFGPIEERAGSSPLVCECIMDY